MTDELFLPEPPIGSNGGKSSATASSGKHDDLHRQIEGQISLSPKELSSELFSVSLLIQQSKELHQKLGHVCDALVNLCGFSFASVVLFNDTKNSLRIRSAHIKTLSNSEGFKTREFFESVARPGTELIRQYYDAVFQDQYEVVNTYCVPPETTYPILQVSGISDPNVARHLIRFGVVPQVLDDSRRRMIIPSVQKNAAQKATIFLVDNRPIDIFIAFYNGTLPSDENETYGIYIPVRNSSGKILGMLSLGPRIGESDISQEAALAYHCAFEPMIRHLALELENEELRQLVATGLTEIELFKPADFTQFLAGLEKQETDRDKFEFICNQVLKLCKPEIVFGVIFNGSLLIEKTSLATCHRHLEKELTEFYQSNFSVGSSIHAEFLGALFLPEYQVSNSFLLTDEQLSSIETYSRSRVVFRNGMSREKLAGEGTLFTPIYNKNGLITGYVASVFDPIPNDARPVAEAIEFYTQFIGNEPFVTSDKALLDQVSHRTQFTSVFDLADSLHYYPTIEEKAQTIARGILRIGGLNSATIVLYNRQDQIEHQRTYSASETEDAPLARPAALCKSDGVEKFTSDAIFMTPGFKFNQCYSFSADQVVLLLSELESGNEVPIELCSSFIGEENLENFLKDPGVGIFIPMMSGKNIFGYVGLGDPLPDTTLAALKDRLSLLTIFINKAAAHLWQLRLEQETAEQSRGNASLKELLSSLFITNAQLQSDTQIERKIEKVVDAIVELFGLTYVALVIYDKSYKIAYDCYKVHPQSGYTDHEKIFEQRFKPGRLLSEQVLKAIFSEPFSAGPCAVFKVPQLKALIRREPLSYSEKSLTVLNGESVSITSIGLENISGYLNGNQKTGLMLPLYGEQGRLAGTVGLGGLMFAGNIADATEFIERIKIIAHFADQIFRDYQLSQAEAEREEESSKLRKKNLFIQ
ncbi:MAG: hypothetical protein HGB19_06495, partial [Chlorobiales bacterium]|nr:hypothetical protein [Chlorobiales bacterium]